MSATAFPVAWPSADDAARPWTQERLHFPDPVAPLEFAVIDAFTTAGLTAAAARFGLPLETRMRRLNGYVYQSTTPSLAPGPDLAARMDAALAPLLAAAACLARDWRARHLPEVQRHLRELPADGPVELLGRVRRLGEVHFLVVLPGLVATSVFLDLHRELLGDDGDAQRLLGGFETLTLAGDRELWRLAERLRGGAGVDDPSWSAALRAFLAEHGHRTDGSSPVGAPSWAEAPGPVIERLRQAAHRPGRDPEHERAAQAAGRDAAHARVRARLPAAARPEYERLLAAAQAWAVLSEDHAHWIDLRAMGAVRRALLAAGERLGLDRPADVLFLEPVEVSEPPPALRALVARRRAEQEGFAHLEPPAVLGTFPPGPPPEGAVARAIGRYLGTPPPPAEAATITGSAGSPGRARGPARVLRGPADAARVAPGDVLVAPTTSPALTPLFGTVAAVVTETGGVLSHAATIAREYAIPAVVGAPGATTRIPDGAWVEVDGAAGMVRLMP